MDLKFCANKYSLKCLHSVKLCHVTFRKKLTYGWNNANSQFLKNEFTVKKVVFKSIVSRS